MKIRDQYTCPLEITHDITKGKWKPILLWQLGKGPCSLSGLAREINGINQKMLLEHLAQLKEYGLVLKKNATGYPLRVEYSLTARGEKLLEALNIMQQVGMELLESSFLQDECPE